MPSVSGYTYYNETDLEYDTESGEQGGAAAAASSEAFAAPGRSLAGTTAPIWVMLFPEGEAPRSDMNLSEPKRQRAGFTEKRTKNFCVKS